MEGHLEGACAPQWMDFTEARSPKVTQDFFNKAHTVEFKREFCDSTLNDIQFASQEDVSSSNTATKMQEDLRIIKSTPVQMISPNRDNKELITTITYDEVFSDAIKTLESCQKSSKERDASNKTNQESPVFKIPGVSKINKSSRSIGFYNVLNQCQSIQSNQDTMLKSESINKKIKNINMRRTLPSQYLFKQDDAYVKNNTSKVSHVRLLDYAEDKERDRNPNEQSEGLKESNEKLNEKSNEEHEKENNDEFKSENRNEENNKEQDEFQELTDEDEDNEDEEGNKQDDASIIIGKTKLKKFNKRHSVLTWQNHRRTSVYKRRMSINSSAETIPCFQNETPKRYPARKTKNNTPALFNPSKLMQNRTPISPTLVSKNGTRAVTVPSQEKRGKPTPRKKRQIKAKPVPAGVSRMVPKVTKKPANTYSASQSKSGETACATNLLCGKNSPSPAGKTASGSKNTVLKIAVINAEGIVVERQAISFFGVPKENRTKRVTRVQPFSFEARNKELQMKKEQALKRIQEANVFNRKFRARPAPNFSKPVNDASRGRRNVEGTKNAACAEDGARYREESKKRLEQEKHTKAKLYKLTEVKTRPMPKYKPPVVVKSKK